MAGMVLDAPRSLPVDPAELAASLPDVPQWLYARSLLLSGAASVRLGGAREAALVLDATTGVLVGPPDPELLADALATDPPGPPLLVLEEAVLHVQAALPGWTTQPFVVPALPRAITAGTPVPPGVVVSAPLDPAVLTGLPEDVLVDAAAAPAAAVSLVDRVPVAVCFVADLTETLWDVGVDTVELVRRQGHGTAVFRALAATLAAQGRQPVWAAYEHYPPSLALAARLGFRPVARMAELTPPD